MLDSYCEFELLTQFLGPTSPKQASDLGDLLKESSIIVESLLLVVVIQKPVMTNLNLMNLRVKWHTKNIICVTLVLDLDPPTGEVRGHVFSRLYNHFSNWILVSAKNESVVIVQWENKCISPCVLPVIRVQFPVMVKFFKGFFPDHTLPTRPEQAWQKMA